MQGDNTPFIVTEWALLPYCRKNIHRSLVGGSPVVPTVKTIFKASVTMFIEG